MLQGIDDNFQDTVDNARVFTSKLVHKRSQNGSKACSAQKSRQKECRYIDIVRQVECVHVCTLHPIGQHDDRVYCNVFTAKRIEFLMQTGASRGGGFRYIVVAAAVAAVDAVGLVLFVIGCVKVCQHHGHQ
jgi:hypothetical protein